ncbi:MAG TPA: hypothetical protein GXZ49_07140 [Bacteroidetes bacterium]|nr:hypothetical protein [Bacteroidota bacterium]
MKKTLLIIVVVLAALLILPVVNLLMWSFQAKKPLDILVVDKTVPNFEMLKHKSFFWTIKNDRVVNKYTKRSYSFKKDYYGFVPLRPEKSRLWDKNEYRLIELLNLADSADVLFMADTYGVFTNDWWFGTVKTRRSRKLYGGLNNNDNILIMEMKNRNKLVILESNTFEYPTVEYEAQRIQNRLGMEYSGWMGKYFSSLDTTTADFPIWMTEMYRRQYKQPWTFKKEGIVFLSSRNIIVLEQDNTLNSSMPFIYTDQVYMDKWGVSDQIAFDQWFEVVAPLSNRVISTFKIETNLVGDSLLNMFGISSSFPAVIQDPVNERTYYFTGDFTHYDVNIFTAVFNQMSLFNGLRYSKDKNDTRRFFWLYYRPLIGGILEDYYNSL